jgi:hypothetical protein
MEGKVLQGYFRSKIEKIFDHADSPIPAILSISLFLLNNCFDILGYYQ